MPVKTKKTFDLKTWDGFSELPKGELDYLLDTTALNKRLADGKDNPYRWRVGSFQVPSELKGESLKQVCQQACQKFIEAMKGQDWTLASKVQVYPGQKYAYDVDSGAVLLDKKEIRIRAIFKTNPKPIKIEVPLSSVRQSPEQKATLEEVAKGEGMTPVPMCDRPQK